jgi:Putative Ig domain
VSPHPTVRYVLSLAALLLASCGGGSGGGSSLPAAPTALSYSQAPTFVMGKAISPLTPTVTGSVTAYAVNPSLPGGLSLSTSSGAISGTPTAVAELADYTVTASNAGGSTTTAVAIAVDAVAPSISYGGTSFTLTVAMPAQGLTPTNSGGAAVTWSISPTLSAGLTFSTTTGVITGAPAAVAAPVSYVVTAQNSGGQGTASLTLGVQSVLLDLGHAQPIDLLRLTSSRVLSMDQYKSWVLWDYATAVKLTGAHAVCGSSNCVAGTLPPVDLEGPTLVDETAAGLEVRASSDGSLLTVISTPVVWWKLATDGSYVCAGSATALTAWSPSGAVIASRAGNYSAAVTFAAPGQVQVALGPAGANVVETVTLPSGTPSVSLAFQGTFNSWFLDGQHFLSNTGNTVWTYTNTGVQAGIAALPTVQNLTGQGSWFSTYSPGNSQVDIYKVGASGSPTATYSPSVIASVIPSGLTLGIIDNETGAGTVIDLSGTNLATTNFTAPIAYTSAYAGISGSQWLVGSRWGVLLDGTSIAGTPRYFGYGAAWSIAGSSPLVAVATASGVILYFDAATNARKGTINFSSSQIALSSDGSVLAAAGDQFDAQFHSDWSINIYSLPSGSGINSWPYSYPANAQSAILPFEITLSGSGTALGQVLGTLNGVTGAWTCSRQVTAVTGGPVLWSDTFTPVLPCLGLPIRLSPDGTKVAVSNNKFATSATNVYSNGTLVTAVPGWAVGWLDDSRILTNSYTLTNGNPDPYSGSTIYNSSGTKLVDLPLPELQSLQIVSADSVYDPGSNAIYSTTTGLATWTSASPPTGVGALAGSNVVFGSGSQVLVQPY